ncbi:early nodulin-like protein 2 isoform X2 [Arabidopsis lyrata subsp. lyrata]|uniref:early nodulin-like protein 2 isoform X2 n=1 Tax=Arabidopsis lyrata subsp. lyrata TaxID=81972 RepID=UPI000A29D1B0|nr:early nodulin-like protein 2 isoform X2 [Arabidopsis lyrata subsp. lyrata]|eukprot:XP_020874020.1 early nodulin-like protein 2 isoform X2 [Arabidopsis lyrata subsp. lyrata]
MTFLKMKSLSFFFTILLSLSTFFTISDARKFKVGGSGAWVPNPPENYESWSGRNRFLVHDTLYFSYAKGADSVVEVNKADYDACNSKNPIKRVDDGDSEISLDRYGPFYFISGNEDNCKKGQKLAVVVISAKVPSTAQPPHAAAPGSSTPGGAHSPKSSSPVSPTTSPPGSMAPKSGSHGSPMTSPPAPPKSTSPVSPSSAPMTSPPAPMAPKSSSTVPPSSAPMTSPPGPMAPKSSTPVSNSPAVSPSLAPGGSTSSSPSDSPSGSGMGPSGDGPSASGDITTPAGAPGQKKSSANGMAVMSITTVLSLVLTIFLSA